MRTALLAALVACSHPQPTPTTPQDETATERRVTNEGGSPFCAMSADSIAGACGNTAAECERVRSSTDSQCAPFSSAACFIARIRVSGAVVRFCTPSIRQCDLFVASHHDDLETSDDRCFVYRE